MARHEVDAPCSHSSRELVPLWTLVQGEPHPHLFTRTSPPKKLEYDCLVLQGDLNSDVGLHATNILSVWGKKKKKESMICCDF